MPFQINGKDILEIAEIVSKDSYTEKSTFFDSAKVAIPSAVDSSKRIANAPSGYFWSNDFLADGKMLKSGSASTASRKGCRPQWKHRFTVSAGNYSFDSFITTNSMQNPTMQDFCYYLSNGGGSTGDHLIMEVEKADSPYWSKAGYVFVTAQAAGGNGADSNGKIGGWSGGGGGAGAYAAFVVKAHGMMEFSVGQSITMGLMPESQCTVNCGGNASKNIAGAGGKVVIENDSDYKDWKVIDSRSGANGGNSDNSGGGMSFMSFSHCPEGGPTIGAKTGGSSGSGGGGGSGASILSNGANGGGGNGGNGGTGAGGATR